MVKFAGSPSKASKDNNNGDLLSRMDRYEAICSSVAAQVIGGTMCGNVASTSTSKIVKPILFDQTWIMRFLDLLSPPILAATSPVRSPVDQKPGLMPPFSNHLSSATSTNGPQLQNCDQTNNNCPSTSVIKTNFKGNRFFGWFQKVVAIYPDFFFQSKTNHQIWFHTRRATSRTLLSTGPAVVIRCCFLWHQFCTITKTSHHHRHRRLCVQNSQQHRPGTSTKTSRMVTMMTIMKPIDPLNRGFWCPVPRNRNQKWTTRSFTGAKMQCT